MDNCIFCKIVKGEIPAAKVWEDENFLAFLTISPINQGHTLVISKKHVPYIFDMEDEELGKFLAVCKPIAKALVKAFNPITGKIGIMVAGLEVEHAHFHLIPMNGEGDLNFSKAKTVPFEELEKNAAKIREIISYSQK
ncbi:MAG: HIT family protein [Candidatus Daviesbacteria bacterium]